MLLVSLLSKPLGFVREAVTAYLFGASAGVDAFVIANSLYLVTFGALFQAIPQAGVPVIVFSERKRASFASVVLAVTLITCAAGLALVAFAPTLVGVLAPKFSQENKQLAASMVRLMFPMVLGIVWLSSASAFLAAERRFTLSKLGDLLVNIIIILGIVGFSFALGVYSLPLGWSLGYLLAGAAFLAFLRPFSRIKGLEREAVVEFLKLALPVLLAYGFTRLNLVVDRAFASSLPEGSVAALNYAWRIFLLGALPGFALASVQITRASEISAARMGAHLKRDALRLLPKLSLAMLAVTALLLFLSEPMVRVLFERGAFTHHDTITTAKALFFYSLGLLPYAAVQLFASTLRGAKDAWRPTLALGLGAAVNVLLDSLWIRPFGVAGLAAATSVASAVTAVLMGVMLWLRR